MLPGVIAFARALREAGIPVSSSATLDATRALTHVPLADQATFKAALAACLIKSPAHKPQFDVLFDLHFRPGSAREEQETASSEDVRAAIEHALLAGEAALVPGLARAAVAAFGRLDAPARDWYSNYEVTRALDLDGMLDRLLERDDPAGGIPTRLRRDELGRRIRALRDAILADTRRRAAEQRGPDAVASYAVAPVPEEASFLSATVELAAIRRAIRPLARKLATRLGSRRRRSRRGHVDMRRTLHRSLSTGGVPLDLKVRRPVPHRPDLVVLCDVSSSVARFSRFALMLTHALSHQFSRVRAFVFVDDVLEVTRHLEHEDLAAVDSALSRASLRTFDAHSDYGEVLGAFARRFPDAVDAKTTLLVLGDARTNYRSPRPLALADLKKAAHRVLWLNPEPQAEWDTGDSVASVYAEHVDVMAEVRNLRQLQDLVAREL